MLIGRCYVRGVARSQLPSFHACNMQAGCSRFGGISLVTPPALYNCIQPLSVSCFVCMATRPGGSEERNTVFETNEAGASVWCEIRVNVVTGNAACRRADGEVVATSP